MDYVNGFIEDCKIRGLTKHVCESYKGCISQFLRHYPDPLTITVYDLRDFLQYLQGQENCTQTIKTKYASISSFYDYLIFEGAISSNPVLPFRKRYITNLKHNPEVRQLLTVDDVRGLLSTCNSLLDESLILMFATTGIRRGELLDLTVHDLDLDNNVLTVPPKAKRSNRLIFINEELKTVLTEFLVYRKQHVKQGVNWLWISNPSPLRPYTKKGRISKNYINDMLHTVGKATGTHQEGGPLCQRLTSHCFRHFFTTNAYRSGLDVEHIKFLRGDSMKADAWQIYNHIDQDLVQTEHKLYFPRLLDPGRSPKIRVYSDEYKESISIATKVMRSGKPFKFVNGKRVLVEDLAVC